MTRRPGRLKGCILRPLAGLLAAGFVFLLVVGNLPFEREVMVGVMAMAFALYAVGGVAIAERWLSPWVGGLPPPESRGK